MSDIKYKDINPNLLVEYSLNRATSFVNTNGMIEITLCGLYATTISVLVTISESQNLSIKPLVYGYIIPIFSFVIFTLATNVYSWIFEQLEYYGQNRNEDVTFLTYEQCSQLTYDFWMQKNWRKRVNLLSRELAHFLATFVFRMDNIYYYYFLIYVSTPIVALWAVSDHYSFAKSAGLFLAMVVTSAAFGLRPALRQAIIHSEIELVRCPLPPNQSDNFVKTT